MSGQLETRVERKGGLPRHYLDGKPVHAGDQLEIQVADGSWRAGRYEMKYHPARVHAVLWIVTFGDGIGAWRLLAEGDVLRWPGPDPAREVPDPAPTSPPGS